MDTSDAVGARRALLLARALRDRPFRRDAARDARGGDAARQVLRFEGKVAASIPLAALLALLGSIGASSLGLVVRELQPNLDWWPLLLAGLGPLAGVIYRRRASRTEAVEIRLMNQPDQSTGSTIRLRAHRDELIALELELAGPLDLASDGALLSSPL